MTWNPVMDRAAVDRIVAEVGAKYVPAELDRARLGADLQDSWNLLVALLDEPPRIWKQRRRRLQKIIALTDDLKSSMDDKLVFHLFDHWARAWPTDNDPTSADLRAILDWIAGTAGGYLAYEEEFTRTKEFQGGRSPADWFLGGRLPYIFAQHFGRSGFSRHPTSGKPIGPMIRFVQAALREFEFYQRNGKAYSAETIAKAVQRYKSRAKQQRGPAPTRGHTSWDKLTPAQQAGMLCADRKFQEFLKEKFGSRPALP
jgi:hypothetical protein